MFELFLILHIAGGTAGLIAGTLNLLRKKGDKTHKVSGKVFLYAMLVVGFSSLVLSVLHPNSFLFIVGIFTLYLVSTGYRYLQLKLLHKGQRPTPVDWMITIAMLLTGLIFTGIGLKHLISGNTFGIVFIVFGLLGLFFVRTDLKNFNRKVVSKNYWLLAHLQRMTGAYISALTAFLVVNSKYFPDQIPGFFYWLLPTFVLVPFIIRWSRQYHIPNT